MLRKKERERGRERKREREREERERERERERAIHWENVVDDRRRIASRYRGNLIEIERYSIE